MNNINFLNKAKSILFVLLFLQFSSQPQQENGQKIKTVDFSFLETDITTIQAGYKDGSFTIKTLIEAYLKRIEEIDEAGPGINSIIKINPDALLIAEQLDAEMALGYIRGPLHGIPD